MNDTKRHKNHFPEFPKSLYHYTSQKGLMGILQTKKLWMTNILYLNDSSEFTYTLKLIKSESRKWRLKKGGIREHITDEEEMTMDEKIYRTYEKLESYCDNFQEDSDPECYVFSLSKYPDDLNQWRGYCPEGGVSIGFDTKKLLTILDTNGEFRIEECKYDIELIKKDIDELFSKIRDIFDSDKIKIHDVSVGLYVNTIFLSPHIKHESFKYEKEYRLIYQGTPSERKYRQGKSMIIPYMEFSPLDKGKLPISEIWVSPTPHTELSKLSIKSILRSNGYKDVKVEKSEIPYRSW